MRDRFQIGGLRPNLKMVAEPRIPPAAFALHRADQSQARSLPSLFGVIGMATFGGSAIHDALFANNEIDKVTEAQGPEGKRTYWRNPSRMFP